MVLILLAVAGCGSGGGDSSSNSSTSNNATAKCVDDTYSYSQNCSGTCSSHGGVAVWMGILSACGGDTSQNQTPTNDMPGITLSNVNPTTIPVALQAPFSKNIIFSLVATDARANMDYLECGVYKLDGTYYGGGRDLSSLNYATTIQIDSFTVVMNTETAGTYTLKCSITDTNGNKATATNPITVQ